MLRILRRSASFDIFSISGNAFRYSSLGTMEPPVEYLSLSKVGLFNGGYEVFHDFAIETITNITGYGVGFGTGLVIFSVAMRSIFSPFILISQINALKMQLLAPEYAKIRDDMKEAYKTRDRNKISSLNEMMQFLRVKYNIKSGLNVVPMLQIPFVIYFFWTLQEMAYEIDKYPSMTTDGFLWFKNLTEADPYFALPVIFALTSFWSIHKNPSSAQTIGQAGKYMKYLKYGIFLGIPVTASFPSAIVLNWFIMSAFQLLLNSLVYTNTGKKLVGLPQYLPGSMLEKMNTTIKDPVIKPKVTSYKPNLPKVK